MRKLIGLILFSACTGTIGTGSGGDDDVPPVPVDVQVTVRDGAAGQANVRVIFQNADNTPIAEKVTDAAGIAAVEMPNGGNVTVIRTYAPIAPAPANPTEVYTYVGVKSGDRLVLGHELDTIDTPTAIIVKVPDSLQNTVKVVTPCGSGQGTAPYVPITVAGCPSNLTFYLTDGNQSSVLAHAAYGANVDLGLQSPVGNLTTTLSSTNLLPGVTTVEAETRIMDGTYQLYSSGTKRVDATPANVNMPNLQGVDEMVVATIKATDGTQMVASRQPYAVTPTIIDAGANLLPYVTTPEYTPTAVTWVETGTGAADFVIATLDVTPKNGADEYIRIIMAPHTGLSLAVPLMTGADAVFNPMTNDQIAGTHELVRSTGGYDAARGHAFGVPSVLQNAPMNGSVTISYAGNTPPTL
jgi:hypothetical protein